MPRRSVAEAEKTRRRILRRAADQAGRLGLEGVTIGVLADDLHMSKAGVLGHFRSKARLQLAVIDEVVAEFVAHVWTPSAGHAPGLSRLEALCEAWFAYFESDDLPDGCFLTAASCEFDGRPGPIRDAVAQAIGAWLDVLTAEVTVAQSDGDLPDDQPPDQVAFEINAVVQGANQGRQLLDDPHAFDRARSALRRILTPA